MQDAGRMNSGLLISKANMEIKETRLQPLDPQKGAAEKTRIPTKIVAAMALRFGCIAALLFTALGQAGVAEPQAKAIQYPPVVPGYVLTFPKDQGSHPDFRTEWWYITGQFSMEDGETLGFQITFFRSRPPRQSSNPSRFAPHQLIFAHAALADFSKGHLVHDERAARAGFTLAGAEQGRTQVWIEDWMLGQAGGVYRATIPARDFQLKLTLTPSQPVLLHGRSGYSQKGPEGREASYYYSEPQLRVSGTLERQGRATEVQGSAWLDHEWSSAYLDPNAVGWDWIGINLKDGGALMAFRMRTRQGGTLWAGGTHRFPDGRTVALGEQDVSFLPHRGWLSPHTGIRYPLLWEIRLPALRLTVEPLMDDQELDARASTGTIYWEGAVHAKQGNRIIGTGYLEMTGYGKPLRF